MSAQTREKVILVHAKSAGCPGEIIKCPVEAGIQTALIAIRSSLGWLVMSAVTLFRKQDSLIGLNFTNTWKMRDMDDEEYEYCVIGTSLGDIACDQCGDIDDVREAIDDFRTQGFHNISVYKKIENF